MRKIRFIVAASLDGYIAGPKGEIDWIVIDPEIDFEAIYKQFDTALIGRKTYETMLKADNVAMPGMKMLVFSRTLRQQDHPKVTIVAGNPQKTIAKLRNATGKDIWLFGGGALFRSLAEAGFVDTMELSVMPVLLGGGVPLFPTPAPRINLSLTAHKIYKSGVASLTYSIT
jgi:dihydrofolate reductase